jgi:hypothetical protein
MRRLDKPPIPEFDPDEYLYRRTKPGVWKKGKLSLDAIELPELSVNRSSLGPAEWVLLTEERFSTWGIAKFKVRDIPTPMTHLGIDAYDFRPVHDPDKNNYPHSVVRVWKNGAVVDGEIVHLDRELHLRWRRALRLNIACEKYA